MSAVKRYEPRDPAPTQHSEGSFVLSSDYDSLLSVLRRCVEILQEETRDHYCESVEQCHICSALSAARAVLEEEAKP